MMRIFDRAETALAWIATGRPGWPMRFVALFADGELLAEILADSVLGELLEPGAPVYLSLGLPKALSASTGQSTVQLLSAHLWARAATPAQVAMNAPGLSLSLNSTGSPVTSLGRPRYPAAAFLNSSEDQSAPLPGRVRSWRGYFVAPVDGSYVFMLPSASGVLWISSPPSVAGPVDCPVQSFGNSSVSLRTGEVRFLEAIVTSNAVVALDIVISFSPYFGLPYLESKSYLFVRIPYSETLFRPALPATVGTFSLSYGGQETAKLPLSATAADVQTALRDLSSIHSVNVSRLTCACGVCPRWRITFSRDDVNSRMGAPFPLLEVDSAMEMPYWRVASLPVHAATFHSDFKMYVQYPSRSSEFVGFYQNSLLLLLLMRCCVPLPNPPLGTMLPLPRVHPHLILTLWVWTYLEGCRSCFK